MAESGMERAGRAVEGMDALVQRNSTAFRLREKKLKLWTPPSSLYPFDLLQWVPRLP